MPRGPALVLLALSVHCRRAQSRPEPPAPEVLALAPIAEPHITAAQVAVRAAPREAARWLVLSDAFVAHARARSDPSYYTQAREAADRALALDPDNASARLTSAMVMLSEHRFADVVRAAEDLTRRAPGDWRAWALLGDGQSELGRYREAVASYQKLLDLQPGLSAYSRVGWLRWVSGDPEGALEMMQLAVDSGSDEPEALAWAQVDLGRTYFMTGRLDPAERAFATALEQLPEYSPAWIGRARVLGAHGKRA